MPITNDSEVTLTLTLAKVNLVLVALRKLPHETVDELIQEIRAQIIPQLKQSNIQTLRPGAD